MATCLLFAWTSQRIHVQDGGHVRDDVVAFFRGGEAVQEADVLVGLDEINE
jgi:hypothetical protein